MGDYVTNSVQAFRQRGIRYRNSDLELDWLEQLKSDQIQN